MSAKSRGVHSAKYHSRHAHKRVKGAYTETSPRLGGGNKTWRSTQWLQREESPDCVGCDKTAGARIGRKSGMGNCQRTGFWQRETGSESVKIDDGVALICGGGNPPPQAVTCAPTPSPHFTSFNITITVHQTVYRYIMQGNLKGRSEEENTKNIPFIILSLYHLSICAEVLLQVNGLAHVMEK